jgi:lipopolysaccharide export system permease protein
LCVSPYGIDRVVPKRRLSLTLVRYIAREFTTILMLCIVVMLAFFLVAAIFDDLEDLLDARAPALDIVRYFALCLPSYLADAIPVSLLLTTTFVLARLCRHNEMAALRASGVSILTISLPIWIIAGLCAGLQFTVAEWLAPISLHRATAHKEALQRKHRTADWPATIAYRNRHGRRDWLFEDFSPREVSRGVRVSQYREDGTIDWELRAARAKYRDAWIFEDVVIHRFGDTGDIQAAPPEHHEQYENQALLENPEHVGFNFQLHLPDELTTLEIRDILRGRGDQLSTTTVNILKAHLYRGLFMPLACILAVVLGVPLAVTTERGTAMRGFVVALGIMLFYFVSNEICMALAKNQTIAPLPAAFAAPAIFLGWGIFALSRIR